MWNLVGQVVSIIVGVVGLAGLIVTYLHSKEANDIDRFEAIVKALEYRVDSLERELGTVKQALVTEQGEHAHTRKIRDAALRFIREVLSWHDKGAVEPPPTPSAELLAEL